MTRVFSISKLPLVCVLLAIVLAAANLPRDSLSQRTPVDRFINFEGYALSRLAPHSPKDSPLANNLRTVLPPKTKVYAVTPVGPLTIVTGNGLLRSIEWDGVTREVELKVYSRTKGLPRYSFEPGQTWSGYDCEEHKGVNKCQYVEQFLDFKNAHEFSEWLQRNQNSTLPYVYTPQGIVIGWTTKANSETLTVEVYQVLIDGTAPTSLPGGDDKAIKLAPQPA